MESKKYMKNIHLKKDIWSHQKQPIRPRVEEVKQVADIKAAKRENLRGVNNSTWDIGHKDR